MKRPFIIILLLFSCANQVEITDTFLPGLKNIENANKISDFSYSSNLNSYSKDGDSLPELMELSKKIKPGNLENSNLFFSVDHKINLPQQGYIIDIQKNMIEIKAKDYEGLFYSFVTMNQLLYISKSQKKNIPIKYIEDYPALSYRSVHIDVKHHLEKKEYYFDLIDQLASIKINGIIVEFEDKLKYNRSVIAAPEAYSIDFWKELSEYAIKRNIKISPLIQGLGHASFILKHDKYKHLRDIPESDWAFNPLNQGTYDVQFDLYKDALEATPYGQYLHVGGDEVRVINRNGKKGFELNLYWLKKVSEFAEKNKRTPIFWDDMYLKYGEVWNATLDPNISESEANELWELKAPKLNEYIDEFPKNCIYMRWSYFRPWGKGNVKSIDWYKENNIKVMGATAGQTRWILMPQDESNIKSIKSFALTSTEKKLDGLLLTLWDDDSPHFELYKRGIHAFAEYTWTGKNTDISEFKNKFNYHFFNDKNETFDFIDSLDIPVRDWANLFIKKGKHRNSIIKSDNYLYSHLIDLPIINDEEWLLDHREKIEIANNHLKTLEIILNDIKELKSLPLKNMYTLEIYEQVAKLAHFSYKLVLDLSEYARGSFSVEKLLKKEEEFQILRNEFEMVYSKTRVINKSENYILDQDHHRHTANQSINMDWQFIGELKLFEKLNLTYN
jgi:hypothetical protein